MVFAAIELEETQRFGGPLSGTMEALLFGVIFKLAQMDRSPDIVERLVKDAIAEAETMRL